MFFFFTETALLCLFAHGAVDMQTNETRHPVVSSPGRNPGRWRPENLTMVCVKIGFFCLVLFLGYIGLD